MNKIDVEKNLLENMDYLKRLVKIINTKSVSDFDSNLIYEVIYADAYVDNIILQVKDAKLVVTLGDIKTALDLVISKIPIKEIAKQRESKDYKKLAELKYSDPILGSFEENVPYKTFKDSPAGWYIWNKLPVLIIDTILFWLAPLMIRKVGMAEISACMALTQIVNSVSHVFVFIVSCLYCVQIIKFTFDLIYICLPSFRDMFDEREHSRLYSIYAKMAVEIYDDQPIHFKKVKNYNRIKRNLLWLDSMISHMRVMELDKEKAALYIQLIALHSELDGGIEADTEKYYREIAKIEFLHNKYIALIDK